MMVSRTFLAFGLFLSSLLSWAGDYSKHPEAQKFIDSMVEEHNLDREQIELWIASAKRQQAIIEAISRPAEKTKPWYSYRNIFLKEDRIHLGADFWLEHESHLTKVEEDYGVPAEIIVAIIGVETYYGRHMGKYRVIDALTTLAFDYPPRSKFFTSELSHFLLLVREQKQDPLALMGSYAGAMGFGQFIPSSYRHYARDGDDDGLVDIWTNKKDAITSVAYYFSAHGWKKDQPVVAAAKRLPKYKGQGLNQRKRPEYTVRELTALGFEPGVSIDEEFKALPLAFELEDGSFDYKLGFKNFYVITRYNHSRLYALAVWELSQAIKARKLKSAASPKSSS